MKEQKKCFFKSTSDEIDCNQEKEAILLILPTYEKLDFG